MAKLENRFMSWRDLVITPIISGSILILSGWLSWLAYRLYHLDSFLCFLIFFILQTMLTLFVLKLLRIFLPIKEGTFKYQQHPMECFAWNLYGYLCISHLNLFYDKILLPIPFRKIFYQMMGAPIGKGLIPISGQLLDPHLITIEENAHIGEDALLTPHAVTSNNQLYIRKIHIGKQAMVGAKSTLMPGVKVGEGAMINAMSLVTMNCEIPPYEVWGGIPARKLKSLRPDDNPSP